MNSNLFLGVFSMSILSGLVIACGTQSNAKGGVSDTSSSDGDSDRHTDSEIGSELDGDTDSDTDSEIDTDTDSDTDGDTDSADGPEPLGTFCPPLSAPTGDIVNVGPEDPAGLREIAASLKTGDTLLFADGTYSLNGTYLWIDTPGVTLRSKSGNPDAVVLDGGYMGSEVVTIAASDVTVAELTIARAYTHGIHVTSSAAGDTVNTLIYRVHVVDSREQAVKINPHDQSGVYVDDGEVACSLIRLTDAGRPNVNPTSGGCYTGGVDAHQARGWVIRDNLIEGFWCDTGLSEHAVHFWCGCRDTLVERNRLVDNARGIGFGLMTDGDARTYGDDPCPAANGGYVGHYGGLIRNNEIFVSSRPLLSSPDGFDCGICLWSACGAAVVHNTVISTGDNFSSIEWRFESSQDELIANNLASHTLRQRDGASATELTNLAQAPLSIFVSLDDGDLHLTSGATDAVDMGTLLEPGICDADIEGNARPNGPLPDLGAFELQD